MTIKQLNLCFTISTNTFVANQRMDLDLEDSTYLVGNGFITITGNPTPKLITTIDALKKLLSLI